MNPRQSILFSRERLPSDSSLYLADDEAAAWLNAHAAPWHPAALSISAALPHSAPPADQEQPLADGLYAVADEPPEGWLDKARAAGAVAFRATADRTATLANLRERLAAHGDDELLRRLLDLPHDRTAPFFAIGYGYAVLSALFEAMSRDNALPVGELQEDIRNAILAADLDAARPHLQSAADRMLAAREVAYPTGIFVIDMTLLDGQPHGEIRWPGAWHAGQPCNVLASASVVRSLQPEALALLREKVAADLVEIIGGCYAEREDPLLPIESQLWNLRRGQEVYKELLGREARVFGRVRSGMQAATPMLLQNNGLTHALLVCFDQGTVPPHYSTVISWPSADGKQVEAFTRVPQPAGSPQTYFHLAHHLHQTVMQDQTACIALAHRDAPAPPSYQDWLELSRFAPVLGRWVTLSSFFSEAVTGDYTSPSSPDEFQGEYLLDRTGNEGRPADPAPISGFARRQRGRRKLDAAHTFAAVLHALGGKVGEGFAERLNHAEDRFESGEDAEPAAVMEDAAQALANRLLARGQPGNDGWLLLNPCSFIRRVALELPGASGAMIPVGGPVKAAQTDGDLARVVVEVPALGFAWVPARGGAAMPPKIKLADERGVRNEFFEAEIDPQTGGLRGLRDHRTRVNRLAQLLTFAPGGLMKARQTQVTSAGPALGEVVVEGDLVDPQSGALLATFRQRYRMWLSRPMLELRIELTPQVKPEGYAWHSYYSARFAWRDENTTLLRGTFGSATPTHQRRPETPDFLDLRAGSNNTVLFPGGLPFHQLHGSRGVDVLLVCPGETQTVFELGVGLDRGQPAQTALGLTSPVGVVRASQGPPHVGATGWLFHLDAPNVLLTSLRTPADGADAVIARLLESSGYAGQVGFRCVRNPARAFVQNLRGETLTEASVEGDLVRPEVGGNDLVQLRVEFS